MTLPNSCTASVLHVHPINSAHHMSHLGRGWGEEVLFQLGQHAVYLADGAPGCMHALLMSSRVMHKPQPL